MRPGHGAVDEPVHADGPAARTGIVIVGAGVAGLSAAWRLHRAGFDDYVVLELEDEPAGTARGGVLPRSQYPMGAHYLPAPHRDFTALQTLLEDLGVMTGREPDGTPIYDARAIVRAPVERHRHRGLWHEGLYPASGAAPSALAQLDRLHARLRTLDGRDDRGRRMFDLPLWRSSTAHRELDGITMAQWLDREGFDDWRVRWLCDYGCRDDYGCTIEEVSAFAALHHFVARGLEDDRDRLLLSWPQGNAELCARIIQRTDGARLHPGHAVLRIDADTGEVLARELASERTIAFAAGRVLWAAPRFVMRHVVRGDGLPADAITYSPWLVANVEVSERPGGTGAPLSWDNVAIDAPHLGYVVANHNEDLAQRRRGGAVLTYYEPWCAPDAAALAQRRQRLLSATLDELCDHVLAQLEAMHGGITRHVRAIDVSRWGHAMVRPVPGALFSARAEAARLPVGRVVPCAADTGGLPLFEQAFALGVRAAEDALAALGHPSDAMIAS